MKFKNRVLIIVLVLTFIVSAFFIPQNVQAQTTKGIDVYEYDNISNYQSLKNGGVQVVIQKATQGQTHNDSLLNYRATHIKDAGIKVGYYHFADNDGNATGQAKHFLSKIKGLKSDTVYWLDIENEDAWGKATAINFVKCFNSVMSSNGYKMGVYTGLSFYYDYLAGNIDSSLPVWLASYGRQPQQYPNKVSWQYSESGSIDGIIGDVDKDYFIGNIYLNNKPAPDLVKPKNSYSPSVKLVQAQLNRVMNSNLKEDGILCQKTIDAIANFQNMEGITAKGNVTTLTQQCLKQILNFTLCRQGLGNWGAVKYIQYRLGISVDGVYGQGTAEVIGDYQLSHGIVSDGICGQNTWKVLFK